MTDLNRVEALARRPWSREIFADEGGGYVARVPELVGCFANGESPAEALRRLDDVLRDWLAIALEEGRRVPEPRSRNVAEVDVHTDPPSA